MPDHDKLLMMLALLGAGVLLGMLVIDLLMRRRDDTWLEEFADSASLADLAAERERFWRFVNDAENMRLIHLGESEAAALANSIRITHDN